MAQQLDPGARRRTSTFSDVFARVHTDVAMKIQRPTTIVGMLEFERPLDRKHIEAVAGHLVKAFPRFRSRIVRESRGIVFEEQDVAQVDLSYHVREEGQAENWGQDDVDRFLTRIYNEDKDVSRPMWRFHILNLSNKYYLVPDIDHSMGDGTSLVSVLNAILDKPFSGGVARTHTPTEVLISAAGTCFVRTCAFIEGLVFAATNPHVPRDPVHLLKRPGSELSPVGDSASVRDPVLSRRIFLDSGHLRGTGRPRPVPQQEFLGDTLARQMKRSAVTEGVDLNLVRSIKAKFPGATVNDILTAVLGMCLRRVYEEANDTAALTHRGVRVALPVNIRQPGENATELRNRIGSRVVRLGMQYARRADAVWRVMRQTTFFRFSPLMRIEETLASVVVKIMPPFLLVQLIREMNFKATAVVSNVSGPSSAVHIGGNEVKGIMFYGIGPVPLYIGFLTYNGSVKCGIVADGDLPHPACIARHWPHEMAALAAEVDKVPGTLPPPPATVGDWAYSLFLLSLPIFLLLPICVWIGRLWM